MRDLRQVGAKLKVVLQPLGKESQNDVLQKLRECTYIISLTSFPFFSHESVLCRGLVGTFASLSSSFDDT